MKKSIKFLSLLIMTLAMVLVGKENVLAESAPSKLTVTSKAIASKPLGLNYNINVKSVSGGRYIYCYDVNKTLPNGTTYTRGQYISDTVMSYIVASGIYDKTEDEFFATQAALWIYLLDTGKMKDTSTNYIANIKKAVYNKDSGYYDDLVALDIRNILTKAYSYKSVQPEISITTSNVTFTLKNGYYTSNTIKVSSTIDYSIALSQAPTGAKVTKTSGGFYVTVPESSVASGKTISFKATVSGSKTLYATYKYEPSNTTYQSMLYSVAFDKTVSDNVSMSITKEKELDNTVVIISKKDSETNKELSGATLVVKNSSGKTVKTIKTTGTATKLTDLAVGSYTVQETKAPDGYYKTSKVYSFSVKADGKITTVTVYNTPIEEEEPEPDNTVVIISKKDSETNKELSGATLVVKNSSGKTVKTIKTTGTATKLTNLAVGSYTVQETDAPDGYYKTSKVYSFSVKADGKTITVTVYNTPIEEEEPKENTKIYISKKDITTNEELAGATLVVRDSKGNEIDRWVSTNEPHYMETLAVGTYTLEEIQQPNGYILSTEKITFEVSQDGKIKTVTMYNTPEEVKETIVSISKKDITTKEELPGATLVVRDNQGNEIDKWESGDAPHIIKGLAEGTYTLEEITQPEGYVLSTEKITFEVKNNGVVTEVVMFNTPEVTEIVVPPTGVNASTIMYVLGGLVIAIGSVLIFKNAKKQEQ